ncbi:non-hydrolyzing UDP-N-acetylglucosamine 2-epimerase [Saccharopolyspora sp. SCSIO 74807]|uniref:non-hydrolyzing UDP-N-acetylglucosamine 2-epimerase n=1 Tax=Saccharopolyspora sp. SCSIO 74807 TaxID=3118084 RepID=UPI0030CDDE24
MRVAIVAGTRPEFIKLAPVRALLGQDARIIHTGQHYSAGLTGRVGPDLVLDHDPGTSVGGKLGSWTSALDRTFREYQPDAVLVQGDTTSALAGALAANTTRTPLVHIEAGLRSRDRSMPEEHNRILIDHLADLCCAPSEQARDNLRAERISASRIETTGNTIVEAVEAALPASYQQEAILDQLGLTPDQYILTTIHRPENADDADRLATIFGELAKLPIEVVVPLHPRTQQQIEPVSIAGYTANFRITGPLNYPALLTVIQNSAAVVSDSGGIQEEITVLKRPIVVVRRSNERPEIESTFGTRVPVGSELRTATANCLADVSRLHARLAALPSPYGDGSAAVQIVRAMRGRFDS